MLSGGDKMGVDLASLNENDIYKKSSQELTGLLYDGLIQKLEKSIICINNKKYLEANGFLQQCNDIFYRLGAGINYEAGMIADQLEAIYNYMADKIVKGNITKDTEPIKEVLMLIEMIADSWNIAMENSIMPSKLNLNNKVNVYEQSVLLESKTID